MTSETAERTPTEPQSVLAPLTRSAIFLVLTVEPGEEALAVARDTCAEIGDLVKAVGFRDLSGQLSCIVGFGSEFWDRMAPTAGRPAHLRPFRAIQGAKHEAISTPGDLLFHIRAERFDLCFELARQVMTKLDGVVRVADEVHGFRYFDARDLLGFVDGTENPTGDAMAEAALIGEDDPAFAGGSYVIVQKYLHDLRAWNALSTEVQELAVGRTKLDDIELDDDVKPTSSHVALTTIEEPDGTERQILRDNMPFGSVGDDGAGTYFIGYAADPAVTELMIERMFVGDPPGNYDRLLDVSTAVTGTLLFVPSLSVLEGLAG